MDRPTHSKETTWALHSWLYTLSWPLQNCARNHHCTKLCRCKRTLLLRKPLSREQCQPCFFQGDGFKESWFRSQLESLDHLYLPCFLPGFFNYIVGSKKLPKLPSWPAGFHNKFGQQKWRISLHKIPTFFGPKMLSLWVKQQTTPELTELKRKHPPSSLARVWVGAGGSAFFGKNASLRSQLVAGPVWTVFLQMVFCSWRNYFSAVFCVWGCCNNLEGDLGGSPGGSTVSHWKKWCQGVNSHQWAVADLSLWGPCLDWTQIKKSWLYFFCLLYIYYIYYKIL